jgi:hypothetical protein
MSMSGFASVRRVFFWATAVSLLAAAPAVPQARGRVQPRLEAVAETNLLMQGMILPNFEGLQRHFKEKPANNDVWTFARGQALIVAEGGNLLLMRPPRNQGQDAWMEQAMNMRSLAARLARSAASRDYEASRAGLVALANACNRCHQTFRVGRHLEPLGE